MKNKYFIYIISLIILLTNSCQKEEVIPVEGSAESIDLILNDDLIVLDTNTYTYQSRLGDTLIFEIEGQEQDLSPGKAFIYSGAGGYIGRIEAVDVSDGLLKLMRSKISLRNVYDYISVFGTEYPGQQKGEFKSEYQNIIQNGDSISIDELEIYDSWIGSNRCIIDVRDVSIRLRPELSYYMEISKSDPEHSNLKRFSYRIKDSVSYKGNMSFFALGPLAHKDSLLIGTYVSGPYFMDLVSYYVEMDVYIGFNLVANWRTNMAYDFDYSGKAELGLDYHKNQDWRLNLTRNMQMGFADSEWTRKKPVEAFSFISTEYRIRILNENTLAMINSPGKAFIGEISQEEWLEKNRDYFNHYAWFIPEVLDETLLTGSLENTEPESEVLIQSGALENSAPIAIFRVNTNSGYTDTYFEFDATECYDEEDPVDLLQIRWDFDSDEHYDTDFSNIKVIEYRFPVEGYYTVTMEVKDLDGASSFYSKEIRVQTSPSAPQAYFEVSPETGYTTTIFIFDASESSDKQDQTELLKIRWDWDSDGFWDTGFSTTKIVAHAFENPGDYVVKLEVKDTEGLTGSTSRMVHVENFNIRPEAKFTVNPEVGTLDTSFKFDASESSDTEDEFDLLQFRWDFSNDGVWDTEFSNNPVIYYKYTSPGEYRIKLEVRDTDGLSGIYIDTVLVKLNNTAPIADYTFSPNIGTLETVFRFDASISEDAEDPLESLFFRWDWNNDDTWDTEYVSNPIYNHQFDALGYHLVKLQVTDSNGATDTKTRIIEIIDPKPVADFSISPETGDVNTLFNFNALISTDPNNSLDDLMVRWDWEGDGTWDTEYSNVKLASHQFSEAGEYSIILEVKDPDGNTDKKIKILLVREAG